jgi:polysaccharide biosynthesis protein PslH
MRSEILYIGHRIPFPPNRGDKMRAHHVLKRLAKLAPLHIATFADDEDDLAEEVELAAIARSYKLLRRTKSLVLAGLEALAKGCPVSLTAFYHAELMLYVNDLLATGKIGTIYLFSSQMGQYVPDSFTGRIVMDFVDVDSAKFESYAVQKGGARGWIDGREARFLRAEEERLALRADVSLLVSDEEAALFASRLSAKARAKCDVRALRLGIDSDFYDPAKVNGQTELCALPAPRLIFTGQMDYQPNVAAALRAAKRIMPLIRQSLPDASFHVVGRNPTAELQDCHGTNGVHVWGRVDDIRGWIKGCDMALVPLEIARGIQNKVMEAMAMELPVVLTSGAATGIAAVPGQHYAVAESDADLAAQVVRLVQNSGDALAMGLAARKFVVEQRSINQALAPLAEMVGGKPRISGAGMAAHAA